MFIISVPTAAICMDFYSTGTELHTISHKVAIVSPVTSFIRLMVRV
jgi:hypothetical protein